MGSEATLEREPVDVEQVEERGPDLEKIQYNDDTPPPAAKESAPPEKKPEEEKAEPEAVEAPTEVAPPAWMAKVLEMDVAAAAKAAEKTDDVEIPPELANSLLPADELKAILRAVEARTSKGSAEAQAAMERLNQLEDQQARRNIAATMQHVVKHAYNGVFASDPVLQGDKAAAEWADNAMQTWMDAAAFEALHPKLRDNSKLLMAADSSFYEAVAALAKIAVKRGSGGGQSKPVVPKGAEVASSTPTRQTGGVKFSKEELAEMKQFGITPERYAKDREEIIKMRGKSYFEDEE